MSQRWQSDAGSTRLAAVERGLIDRSQQRIVDDGMLPTVPIPLSRAEGRRGPVTDAKGEAQFRTEFAADSSLDESGFETFGPWVGLTKPLSIITTRADA